METEVEGEVPPTETEEIPLPETGEALPQETGEAHHPDTDRLIEVETLHLEIAGAPRQGTSEIDMVPPPLGTGAVHLPGETGTVHLPEETGTIHLTETGEAPRPIGIDEGLPLIEIEGDHHRHGIGEDHRH